MTLSTSAVASWCSRASESSRFSLAVSSWSPACSFRLRRWAGAFRFLADLRAAESWRFCMNEIPRRAIDRRMMLAAFRYGSQRQGSDTLSQSPPAFICPVIRTITASHEGLGSGADRQETRPQFWLRHERLALPQPNWGATRSPRRRGRAASAAPRGRGPWRP